MPLHSFLQEAKRSRLISSLGDIAFQNFTSVIDGTPEIMLHLINLHEDLIQVPLPLSLLAHVGSAFRSDLSSKDWTKSIDLHPHTFMADIDPALMEQVFDISQ